MPDGKGKAEGFDARAFEYRPGELLLTGAEAAEVLGVHPDTVSRWVRAGRLFAFRIGGTWRYPARAVRRLAKARERGA